MSTMEEQAAAMTAVEDAVEHYWRVCFPDLGADDIQADVFEMIENIDTRY